jgi:hypothetical protein
MRFIPKSSLVALSKSIFFGLMGIVCFGIGSWHGDRQMILLRSICCFLLTQESNLLQSYWLWRNACKDPISPSKFLPSVPKGPFRQAHGEVVGSAFSKILRLKGTLHQGPCEDHATRREHFDEATRCDAASRLVDLAHGCTVG